MRRIVRGFPQRRLARIDIGRPPAEADKRGTWLYYDVAVRDDVDYVAGHWQGLVASGLLRAVGREQHWPALGGHTFTIVLPDGTRRFDSESVIGDAFREEVRQASEAQLLSILRRSSIEAGLSLQSVRFADPLDQPVPQVTLRAEDPRAFVRHANQRILVVTRPIVSPPEGPLAEGILVLVESEPGEWVAVSGHGVRVAGSVAVTNPKFDH
jgi:hypothetical protein